MLETCVVQIGLAIICRNTCAHVLLTPETRAMGKTCVLESCVVQTCVVETCLVNNPHSRARHKPHMFVKP